MDVILIIVLLMGAVGGYRKGFLAELFSLLGIILGILAGFKLMGTAMVNLSRYYDIDDKILPYVAFGVVFIIVAILVGLLGKFLKSSIEKTVLGNADQIAGSAIGILKAAFMASVLLWIVSSVSVNFPDHWTEGSWLYPPIATFAPTVTSWVAEIFPVFSDLFGGRS
ncbi:MAG TPA: CvpA family protein [Cyclobacteriaceae bacterium]|nr:CvpA family protein [Cyclobacteriaceae bacterium]